jgi:hypothetical protein
MQQHSPRACPLGEAPPVGARQRTGTHGCSARGRRPRPRVCLRKGCGRKYQPRSWNQRYCQDPQCLREVCRWQAARRQAKYRAHATARSRHAQAERERRQRAKAAPEAIENQDVMPARGHAAETFFPSPYATDRAATNTPSIRSATRRGIAARRAAKRSATSKIVNASGFLAAPWMAARSEPTGIKPLVSAGPIPLTTSRPPPRRVRLRNDRSVETRRSSIIACELRTFVAWLR